MAFSSEARTHVGLRRNLNEDAVLNRSDLALWAVADGMGGHDRGEVASARVIESLTGIGREGSLLARALAARSCLAGVNEALVRLGREAAVPGTVGATVVVLLCDQQSFICLWAGDSRAYLWRAGELKTLTRDHSLVQRLVDAGEITEAEARDHPNANVITRAVGADPTLEIDVVQGELRQGDRFLLASDGVTRLVSEAEIIHGLAAQDLGVGADHLVEIVLSRGAPDNLSLVLVRLDGPPGD